MLHQQSETIVNRTRRLLNDKPLSNDTDTFIYGDFLNFMNGRQKKFGIPCYLQIHSFIQLVSTHTLLEYLFLVVFDRLEYRCTQFACKEALKRLSRNRLIVIVQFFLSASYNQLVVTHMHDANMFSTSMPGARLKAENINREFSHNTKVLKRRQYLRYDTISFIRTYILKNKNCTQCTYYTVQVINYLQHSDGSRESTK